MALLTNTETRYGQKGLRESLSDIIYDISPEDTPFMSSIGRTGAKQTLEEWQTDVLASADGDNAQLEGDDVSFDAITPSVRVGNFTQISSKAIIVSETVDTVDKAGRKSVTARQIARKGAELKRDQEKIFLRPQGGVSGGAGTARRLASLNAFLKTNVVKHSTGSNPTYTSGVPGSARVDGSSTAAFTETMLKSAIQSVWTEGGTPRILMVGPVNKQRVSGFSGIATRNFDLSNVSPRATAIIASADVYVSDFGTLRVIPNRFQRERDAWVLDWELLDQPQLRPMKVIKLAKTGDATKSYIRVEYSLRVKQEAGLGLIADLTVV